MQRVRVGSLYTYTPVAFDRIRPCQGNTLEQDQIVRVINLSSAPKANSAGHCYVADPYTCKFICMVMTNSLTPLSTLESPARIGRINKQARHEGAAYGRCACGKRIPENSKIPPYHKPAVACQA